MKSSPVGGEYDELVDDDDAGNALPMAPSHSNVSIGSLFVLVVDEELDNSGACEPIAPNTLAVGALKLALNNPFIFNDSEKLQALRRNIMFMNGFMGKHQRRTYLKSISDNGDECGIGLVQLVEKW